MGRTRTKNSTLTGTRIYERYGSYQYLSPEPLLNPWTKKVQKWHILCPVDQGELVARNRKAELLDATDAPKGLGNFPIYFVQWKTKMLAERAAEAPSNPVLKKTWEDGNKALRNVLEVIQDAFEDADVEGIKPPAIALFLDQWEGRRAAQTYKGHLLKFFAWAVRIGLAPSNPVKDVELKKPKAREIRMTKEQYLAIQDALRDARPGRDRAAGEMMCCYMDLLYLLHQRGTDIRIATWADFEGKEFRVIPTKTARSSGTGVALPITDAVRAVLARAKRAAIRPSIYVICTAKGQPYTSNGLGSIFERACQRAEIEGLILKDIRSMAASDAKAIGYTEEQIKVGLAHTDVKTTRGYIREQELPVSSIELTLPKKEA